MQPLGTHQANISLSQVTRWLGVSLTEQTPLSESQMIISYSEFLTVNVKSPATRLRYFRNVRFISHAFYFTKKKTKGFVKKYVMFTFLVRLFRVRLRPALYQSGYRAYMTSCRFDTILPVHFTHPRPPPLWWSRGLMCHIHTILLVSTPSAALVTNIQLCLLCDISGYIAKYVLTIFE